MNSPSSVRPRIVLPGLGRHLRREFLAAFGLTMAAFVSIYVIADFFDRLDTLLKHGASVGEIARLFLFKVPLVITQVTPVAVLAASLVGLGLLARQNEFVAMRACGVSIWQIALPLVAVAVMIGVGAFAWNEFVVPGSARRWHQIEYRDIRKRTDATAFLGRDVWYHGQAGFYRIDRVSLHRKTLYGLVIYQPGNDFLPRRLIEVRTAVWSGDSWRLDGVRSRDFSAEGGSLASDPPPNFRLPETLDDFRTVSVEPEELSYGMLRRQIRELRRKGVDASESWVDLHLKLALPAASIIMMLVAIPLVASGTRVSSLAASIGTGLLVGFGYFVVVAFARALGQVGALPPAVAAWTANVVFALLAGYSLLGAD